MTSCIALVVAAGRGTRLSSEIPKQYLPLGGMPLLAPHGRAPCIRPATPKIGQVRVVSHPDDRPLYNDAVKGIDLLASSLWRRDPPGVWCG